MTGQHECIGTPWQPSGAAPKEPLWYLRINTLRRSRLSDPALGALLARLVDAERAVRSSANYCSAQLYELIGANADLDARRQLVELRRTIHNDRSPKTGQAPTPSVARWLAAREQRQGCRDEIARCYEDAAERERARLATLLGDENLRCALVVSAPAVYSESERYRAAAETGQPVPARGRKAERGLLQYVTRAMMRTSPLSRFTAVGIAMPYPDGIAPDRARFSGAVAFPTLDRVRLSYVVGGLHGPAGDVAPDCWIGLPPTSVLEDHELIFLGRTESGFRRMVAQITGPVRLLLDAVVMGPRPVRSVVLQIADNLDCSPQAAMAVVVNAVRRGMLCSFHEPEDGASDLDDILDQPGTPAAELLADVKTRLPRLATAPPPALGRELTAIGSALSAASSLAGRPTQVTVDEDYVILPGRVATGSWLERLSDLAASVELLSVFDWMHDVRALVAAAFVSRFGPGATVRLVEHAEYLVGEMKQRAAALNSLYRSQAEPSALTGIGPDDGSLEQLYALRSTVTKMVAAGLTKAAAVGQPDWVFAATDAVELTTALPERFRRDPLSYGVLVQHASDRLVLNDGLPGHGMLYARFLDADRRLGGSALPYLASRLAAHYGQGGIRAIEDLGMHRLSVNAHPHVLPDGLRPEDWFSLRLAHDAETDMLRVQDTDGRSLRVLPLGIGHPLLLPPPLFVAASLVIGGRLGTFLPSLWHQSVPWDGQSTRMCPRISVGDVVIARRRWYGGTEFAEAVAAGPDELERLLALTAWRSRHDVPEEIFVKTTPADEGPQQFGALKARALGLRHKPQYVDLTSALSVRVLPRMLERRTGDGHTDYLEEALPAVADGTYATEWVVEISRRPGGRFKYGGELA